jgi:NitT/TauT family transport system substrate-binding protein
MIPLAMIPRKHLHRTRIAMLGGFALALAGCTPPQSVPLPPGDLRAHGMLSTIELAPLHYAIAHLGAAQDPVAHGGIPNLYDGSRFNAAKHADLAGHADTQALRESLLHPDLRIIITITEGHYRIIAKRSAGIDSLSNLKGKRVAMIEETSAHFYLDRLLGTLGMGDRDIEIVSLQSPKNSADVLLDGRADALAMWEPEAQLAIDKLGEDAIVLSGDVGYDELYNLHTTAGKLADPAARAKIVRFVAKLIQASEAIEKDPEPARELVAKAMDYPIAVLRESWPHHSFTTSLSPKLLDVLSAEEEWLAARASRPARSRDVLAQLIDPSIEAEARKLLANER